MFANFIKGEAFYKVYNDFMVDIETEKPYWVGFNVFQGIGPKTFKRLLKYFGSAQAAWEASEDELQLILGEKVREREGMGAGRVDHGGRDGPGRQRAQTGRVSPLRGVGGRLPLSGSPPQRMECVGAFGMYAIYDIRSIFVHPRDVLS